MSEKMNVVIENLRAHASKVDGVAERLGAAADGGQRVALNDDAYGVLCQPFAWMVNQVEQRGIEAIRHAAEGVRDSAEEVRSTAEDYQATDDDNRGLFGGAR